MCEEDLFIIQFIQPGPLEVVGKMGNYDECWGWRSYKLARSVLSGGFRSGL